MPQIDFDGANSAVKTDKIQGQSGTTVTVPTGHTVAITDSGGLTLAGTAVNAGALSPIIGASAYRSGTQLIADSTNVQVQLNAELYDPNSDFDHTSGYDYVVPENGKYVVSVTLWLDNGNTTGYVEVYVYKNGSAVRVFKHRPTITTNQGCGGTCILNLSTNDSIEMWVGHNMGSSIDVMSGSTITTFDIQKIAE